MESVPPQGPENPASQHRQESEYASGVKKSRIITLVGLTTTIVALIYGWATSTRHIEMRFLKNGVPLSGLSFHVIGPSESSRTETFTIGKDGWVKLPSSYLRQSGICGIEREKKWVYEFVENGFDRGLTTVNFTHSGIASENVYRFLFYEKTSSATSINKITPAQSHPPTPETLRPPSP